MRSTDRKSSVCGASVLALLETAFEVAATMFGVELEAIADANDGATGRAKAATGALDTFVVDASAAARTACVGNTRDNRAPQPAGIIPLNAADAASLDASGVAMLLDEMTR